LRCLSAPSSEISSQNGIASDLPALNPHLTKTLP
jgi:hypothetical protein